MARLRAGAWSYDLSNWLESPQDVFKHGFWTSTRKFCSSSKKYTKFDDFSQKYLICIKSVIICLKFWDFLHCRLWNSTLTYFCTKTQLCSLSLLHVLLRAIVTGQVDKKNTALVKIFVELKCKIHIFATKFVVTILQSLPLQNFDFALNLCFVIVWTETQRNAEPSPYSIVQSFLRGWPVGLLIRLGGELWVGGYGFGYADPSWAPIYILWLAPRMKVCNL